MKKTVEQMKQENLDHVLEHGPRLRYGQNTWVEAKDTKKGLMRIGGLGAAGFGTMVVPIGEDGHKRDGFDEAPEEDMFGNGYVY